MKVRFLPLAILALIWMFPTDILAQDDATDNPLMPQTRRKPIYIGPTVGFNRSIHSVELASFVDDPLCPFFPNGTANGFWVGLTGEYLLGNVKNSNSSIIARVLYNRLPASFDKEGSIYPSMVSQIVGPDTNTVIMESATSHGISVTYDLITAEVCYKLNLFNTNFGITIGPTFDFAMSKNIEQTFELTYPMNAKFVYNQEAIDNGTIVRYENNQRKIVVKDGDIEGSSSFRLGIKAGVQYEILMGRMYIVPAAYYNYGILKLTDMEDWYVHALQIGVDVRFAL